MKEKVLLCYVRLKTQVSLHWEYTGLFYLAGALEGRGYLPKVYHGDRLRLPQVIRDLKPPVIGFSCDAENQHFLEALIPEIKRYCVEELRYTPYILTGGPQACGLGETFLKTSGADYILRGEGEQILPDLLDCLFSEGPASSSPDRIPGLCRLDAKGVFCENPGIGIVKDLDTLPRPAYHTSLHKRPYGRVIFSGRGCPFSCAFCASHVGHQTFRMRRIGDVLAEIRENLARDPGIRYIIMQDDTFCANAARVREFCAGMRQLRKERPVVWFCETHVKTLLKDPALLGEMIESGLVRLQVGMESGDPEVLRLYHKDITPKEVLELTELAARMGLPQIAGNFIVGGPREKEGLTEQFVRQLIRTGAGIVDINTGFLRNYPYTAISMDPAAFGLRVTAGDERTAGDDYPGVIPEDSSEEEVVALRQGLNRAIREEMGRCIEQKLIPTERIMAQYRLMEEYGVNSRWTLEISAREHIHEYYRMLYLGEGQAFDRRIPAEHMYPQRTFQFYRGVILHGGIPKLFGMVLSPLEEDILFYSAGKLSVSGITEALWEKWKGAYANPEELKEAILGFLEIADRRYWITIFAFP